MAAISESELTDGIKKEIEYPLAALVSRLRRCATENITTDYIDSARVGFQEALATAIAKAIREAVSKGMQR